MFQEVRIAGVVVGEVESNYSEESVTITALVRTQDTNGKYINVCGIGKGVINASIDLDRNLTGKVEDLKHVRIETGVVATPFIPDLSHMSNNEWRNLCKLVVNNDIVEDDS